MARHPRHVKGGISPISRVFLSIGRPDANNIGDMTGVKVGRITILGLAGRTADGHILYDCRCDCGNTKKIVSNSLRRRDPVRSCGCMNRTVAQAKRKLDGAWNDGKSYAVQGGERCYKTRHAWSKAVIRHYGNRCEVCGWSEARCDADHRVPKAKGGKHTIANGIVLCPNHHRMKHATADAQ